MLTRTRMAPRRGTALLAGITLLLGSAASGAAPKKRLSVAEPAATPTASPSPSPGPTTSGAPKLSEEIVVTARLVEEPAQRVPLTVTHLGALELEQHGATKAADLMYAAPSLTIHPYFNTLTNSYSVRGLSAGQTTYFSESPCCAANAAVPLTDIESVQVLNGPQGTLFGRSSASGAILIRPVLPDAGKFSGNAAITLGDYGRRQISGAINGPLIKDRLALRFSSAIDDVDGYTRSLGSDLRFDEQSSQTFRLGLRFKTARLEQHAVVNYVNLDQSATNQILSGIFLGAAGGLYQLPESVAPAVFGDICARAVALRLESNVNSCIASRYARLAAIHNALVAESARLSSSEGAVRYEPEPVDGNPARLRLRNLGVVDVTQYELRGGGSLRLTLKNILSFESAADVASSPADGIGGLAEQGGASTLSGLGSNNQRGRLVEPRLGPYTRTLTEELQLHARSADRGLSGSFGFFYNRSTQPSTDRGTGNLYQIFGGVFNENRGYNSALGFSAGGRGSETAGYGRVTLDGSRWLSGLELSGGYRYTWSRTRFSSHPAVVDPVSGVFSPGTPTSVAETKSSGANYDLTITENWSDRFMTYASLSRAYVPGGVNIYDSNIGDPSTKLPNFRRTYGPERLRAIEIGAKANFQAGRLSGRLTAALYDYAFNDIQQNFSGTFNNVGFFYIANISAAKHRGFETTVTLAPSRSLELRASYNYNDFRYTKWTGPDPANVAAPGDPLCVASSPSGYCFLDLTSNPAVGMPPHQGHLVLVYRAPIAASWGRLELSAALYAQGRVYFQSNAHRELQILGQGLKGAYSQDAYKRVNLRLHWSDIHNSRFSAGVFVNNAANEIYKLGATAQVLSLGFGTAHYAPPRMFGFQLSGRF